VLAAVAYVYVRVATRTEASGSIVFWFSAVSTLAASPSLASGSPWPAPPMMAALVGVGLVGLLAQLAMTRAYALADAAVVSLYSYATPVLAYALGLVALGELPSVGGVVGVALVALAGAWVTPRAANVHGEATDQEA
jgi:drug/metabolite transporter (DMT)-like permease